jgi:hypothetical protein
MNLARNNFTGNRHWFSPTDAFGSCFVSAYLPGVPNGAVLAHQKHFEPAIPIRTDRHSVRFANLRRWTAETLPGAPKWILINLPSVPEGAVIAQAEDLDVIVELAADINLRCFGNGRARLRL